MNAFIRSPNYRKGALFIMYDEWGGFFDHVRPPRVVDDLANSNLEEDFAQMGFRTPTVAVSTLHAQPLEGPPRAHGDLRP